MIGVVLAGGKSSRFQGQPKGLQLLGGVPLALHVARTLECVCSKVVIECGRDAGYEALGLELIHPLPEHAGMGPLAGIVAGLVRGETEKGVAFAPCDMPVIGADVYRRLMREASGAYATTSKGTEPLVCVLRECALEVAQRLLAQTLIPRVLTLHEQAGAVPVSFDDATRFVNVNSPDELAALNAVRLRDQR